ncbi:MAG: hypothetical protein ACLR8Y_10625 [Alistipes indistinctus]
MAPCFTHNRIDKRFPRYFSKYSFKLIVIGKEAVEILPLFFGCDRGFIAKEIEDYRNGAFDPTARKAFIDKINFKYPIF